MSSVMLGRAKVTTLKVTQLRNDLHLGPLRPASSPSSLSLGSSPSSTIYGQCDFGAQSHVSKPHLRDGMVTAPGSEDTGNRRAAPAKAPKQGWHVASSQEKLATTTIIILMSLPLGVPDPRLQSTEPSPCSRSKCVRGLRKAAF